MWFVLSNDFGKIYEKIVSKIPFLSIGKICTLELMLKPEMVHANAAAVSKQY